MKKCSCCKVIKKLEAFNSNRSHKDGLHHYCKICVNSKGKLWRKKNPEKAAQATKNYQKRNRKYLNLYRQKLRKTNKKFKLADAIRARLSSGLKNALLNKVGKTIDYLGCSYQELKLHLEKQFISDMTWDNYGVYWHIDHIIPLSFCKQGDVDFMKTLTHYTNLRPLPKQDNYKKSNKIDLTLANLYGIHIPESYLNGTYKEKL